MLTVQERNLLDALKKRIEALESEKSDVSYDSGVCIFWFIVESSINRGTQAKVSRTNSVG